MKNNLSTLDKAFIERKLSTQMKEILKHFGPEAKLTIVVRDTGLDNNELVAGNDSDLIEVTKAVINIIEEKHGLKEKVSQPGL